VVAVDGYVSGCYVVGHLGKIYWAALSASAGAASVLSAISAFSLAA
jgi:hypothetical protein